MSIVKSLPNIRTLVSCVTVVFVTAGPAWAQITEQKHSGNFTYQYNGNTALGVPAGNTGYIISFSENISATSDGDILSVFPNDPTTFPPAPLSDTVLNVQSPTWNSEITDATGFTWEIRLKLNPTNGNTHMDNGDGTFSFNGSGPLSRNRVLLRAGTNFTTAAEIQIDMDGNLNNNGLSLPSVVDDFHVYRMAQLPNSDETSLWVDDVLLDSNLTKTNAQSQSHWLGDFWGEHTKFDVDYIRFDLDGFAPGDFVAEDAEDLNMDGFVDGLDLGLLLGNWNQTTTPDMGELNGIPPVDGLDLGILLGAWNPPPLGGVTSVPEPTSLALLGIGVAWCTCARSRKFWARQVQLSNLRLDSKSHMTASTGDSGNSPQSCLEPFFDTIRTLSGCTVSAVASSVIGPS